MRTGDPRALLLRAYGAYNTQDVDELLTLVSDDIDWPDGEGGRLHGKEALRAYWTEQWTRTRTHDEPVALADLDDGRIAVHIDQAVRSLEGSLLSTGRFVHLHRVEGGRVTRLDIERDEDRSRDDSDASRRYTGS